MTKRIFEPSYKQNPDEFVLECTLHLIGLEDKSLKHVLLITLDTLFRIHAFFNFSFTFFSVIVSSS